jgi:hypothetical protein
MEVVSVREADHGHVAEAREEVMGEQQAFSRRHLLAMSAAAASLGIEGGYRHAAAQAAKRIERLDPALDRIISASEPIIDIATNLGGTANVEGPLWWKEGGYLLFRGTDLKRWKYAPGQGISVLKENTNAEDPTYAILTGLARRCDRPCRPSGADRDQGIGAEARQTIAPLAFETDDGAQRQGDRQIEHCLCGGHCPSSVFKRPRPGTLR